MTRAILGHTGRDVLSKPTTTTIYGAMFLAALVRVTASPAPAIYYNALLVAGLAWLLGFGIFLLIYGPMLVGEKQNS